MVPLSALANKTAALQFANWSKVITEMLPLYGGTHFAQHQPLTWQEFLAQVHAFMADCHSFLKPLAPVP
jgi:hypothetical protein